MTGTDVIREIMKKKGITMYRMSKDTNKPIYEILKHKDTGVETLVEICKAYGYKVIVFGGDKNPIDVSGGKK